MPNHGSMNLGAWDILLNACLLVLWFRIWNAQGDGDFGWRTGCLWQATDAIFRMLRPAPRSMNERWIAAALFVVLAAAKTLLFASILAGTAGAQWGLRMGFEQVVVASGSGSPPLGRLAAMTALSFAVFLFMLWSISAIYLPRRAHPFASQAEGTLRELSAPFSMLPIHWRPAALLVLGLAVCAAARFDWSAASLGEAGGELLQPWTWLRFVISTLAAVVGLCGTLQSFVMLLIIGSWISLFSSSEALHIFCREWLDMLLGPLSRYPLRIGFLDLTPIIFFFALGLAQKTILPLLAGIYYMLP